MTKFELDLLKVVSSNGDGDEYSEDYDYCYTEPPAVDTELLKAINQQCKELGWLDD